jgi:predicted ABC-type ATPase
MVVVIGGPNGAGKSTIAEDVLASTLNIQEFVNADTIARGLSGFDPDRAAIAAGRVMLTRLRELANQRTSFAFESTLASRTFAPWLASLKHDGYEVQLFYVALRSPSLALRRVKARVRQGGHDVPADVIRRRFGRSIRNLFSLYLPIADIWHIYDNSGETATRVADRLSTGAPTILNQLCWDRLLRASNEDHSKEADPN